MQIINIHQYEENKIKIIKTTISQQQREIRNYMEIRNNQNPWNERGEICYHTLMLFDFIKIKKDILKVYNFQQNINKYK